MQSDRNILLLSDSPGGTIGADLDVLYPGRVRRLDIRDESCDRGILDPYEFVITVVNDGRNLHLLDYDAVTEFAESGGQVISCLFEYARNRGLHFSKTHVQDRIRPGMRIEVENDVTRGYSVGDSPWWYGTVTSAPDQSYANQMFQRQILGLETSENVSVLGISNLNGGAVLLEESVGDGRIVAMDLASPVRPWYNSWGSTNKYLFLGNIVNNAVRYGKHYPERLSYDGFVDLMYDTAERYPDLFLEDEGRSSDGRPMYSLNVGDESGPTMYFGAAIHGWEWENAYGLLRLAEVLCRNPDVEGLNTRDLHFKILPVQNPGGFDRFTRQNSRGVDLNRNFDCNWEGFHYAQDVRMPWDYNYMGTNAASERETRVIQRIIDRHRPLCVIDFHTADYIMMLPHRGDGELLAAIHEDIRDRLRNRYLTQKPYGGAYQQVNMERITEFGPPTPYCISYAAERGTPAAFLIEMSGNRDDVHALVMNTDTVVEICLAAVKQCLLKGGPT
ncbi:MAG: M14 family metallopeptidase [Gemmatimonadota bacterium]|nr:M14 family metallopeptidase [Gemmatimonadota bacterium]